MAVLLGLVIGWSFYAALALLVIASLMLLRWPVRARRMLKHGAYGVALAVSVLWLGAHVMAALQPGSAWGSFAGRYLETFVSFGGAGFVLGTLSGLLTPTPSVTSG